MEDEEGVEMMREWERESSRTREAAQVGEEGQTNIKEKKRKIKMSTRWKKKRCIGELKL